MGAKISYLVNRRRMERTDARVPVELRPADSQQDFLLEHTRNFSRNGIFLGTKTPLPVGSLLDLVFRIPEDEQEALGKKTLHLQGKVVWTNEFHDGKENPNPGMGIEFRKVDAKTLELLERIVHRIAVIAD